METPCARSCRATITMRVGSLLTQRAMRHFMRRVDHSEYGGRRSLGVAGITIVQPRSRCKAVRAQRGGDGVQVRGRKPHSARRAGDCRRDGVPSDCISVSGTGSEGRHGQALADTHAICRDTFASRR